MPFVVSVESTLEADWGRATQVLATGCREAVQSACVQGAAEARTVRRFRDRTGRLYASIRGRLDSYDRLGAQGSIEAGRNPKARYASFIEGGTKAHIITGRPVLRWQGSDGAVHYARRVNHPGTQAKPFMGPAHLKAERVLEARIGASIPEAQKELK